MAQTQALMAGLLKGTIPHHCTTKPFPINWLGLHYRGEYSDMWYNQGTKVIVCPNTAGVRIVTDHTRDDESEPDRRRFDVDGHGRWPAGAYELIQSAKDAKAWDRERAAGLLYQPPRPEVAKPQDKSPQSAATALAQDVSQPPLLYPCQNDFVRRQRERLEYKDAPRQWTFASQYYSKCNAVPLDPPSTFPAATADQPHQNRMQSHSVGPIERMLVKGERELFSTTTPLIVGASVADHDDQRNWPTRFQERVWPFLMTRRYERMKRQLSSGGTVTMTVSGNSLSPLVNHKDTCLFHPILPG